MSCCCCCCKTPCWALLEGSRKKERLLSKEEGGGGAAEEEQSSRNMDLSLLRAQYRSSREKQRKHTRVLLFRTVSEELSDAVNLVPVPQGLTSLSPNITFEPDPTTYDPWHVHLELHRRSRPLVTVQLPASSSETNTSIDCSFRGSSSSFSEATGSQHESGSSSFTTKQENQIHEDQSRGDRDSESPKGDSFTCLTVDPVHMSVTNSLSASELNSRAGPPDGSFISAIEDPVHSSITYGQESSSPGSQTSSTKSSTPVVSIMGSPSSSTTNLEEVWNESRTADTISKGIDALQTCSTLARKGSRRFSFPANRFSGHQSEAGQSPFTGLQQNQNYYPFPRRRAPKISEAARRLGMYSSF